MWTHFTLLTLPLCKSDSWKLSVDGRWNEKFTFADICLPLRQIDDAGRPENILILDRCSSLGSWAVRRVKRMKEKVWMTLWFFIFIANTMIHVVVEIRRVHCPVDSWHDAMNRSIITNNSSSRVCRSSVDASPPFHCCLDILWVISPPFFSCSCAVLLLKSKGSHSGLPQQLACFKLVQHCWWFGTFSPHRILS